MTGDRKPSKPWRVDGPADHGSGETYATQPEAYTAALELARWGHLAMIYAWENGCWRLYEKVPPTVTSTESPLEAIRRGRQQVIEHERQQR